VRKPQVSVETGSAERAGRTHSSIQDLYYRFVVQIPTEHAVDYHDREGATGVVQRKCPPSPAVDPTDARSVAEHQHPGHHLKLRAARPAFRRRGSVRLPAVVHAAGCADPDVGTSSELSPVDLAQWKHGSRAGEQTATVDPTRLGEHVGHLGFDERRQADAALRIVLEL
jgi:hypothetical protein